MQESALQIQGGLAGSNRASGLGADEMSVQQHGHQQRACLERTRSDSRAWCARLVTQLYLTVRL